MDITRLVPVFFEIRCRRENQLQERSRCSRGRGYDRDGLGSVPGPRRPSPFVFGQEGPVLPKGRLCRRNDKPEAPRTAQGQAPFPAQSVHRAEHLIPRILRQQGEQILERTFGHPIKVSVNGYFEMMRSIHDISYVRGCSPIGSRLWGSA